MMRSSKTRINTKFKRYSEDIASKYRNELGLHFYSKLDAFELAKHLRIPVIGVSKIRELPTEQLNWLIGLDGNKVEWHALTTNKNGCVFIIHNDNNSDVRQQSDIFHELAHIICEHKHDESEITEDLNFLRSYNTVFEEEAKYLGAALHIPFGGLIASLRKNKSYEEISNQYNSSVELVHYRVYSSGAGAIVQRAVR